MRINTTEHLESLITVFLNDAEEKQAIEVYLPGNKLEGRGYVVRGMLKDGKPLPTASLSKPLPAGIYDCDGLACEKVFGHIRIEIGECQSLFEDN